MWITMCVCVCDITGIVKGGKASEYPVGIIVGSVTGLLLIIVFVGIRRIKSTRRRARKNELPLQVPSLSIIYLLSVSRKNLVSQKSVFSSPPALSPRSHVTWREWLLSVVKEQMFLKMF